MFSFTVVFMLYLSLSKAGDPCPPEGELASCTCTRREAQRILDTTPNLPPEASRSSDVGGVRNSSSSETPSDSLYTVVNCNNTRSITELEEDVTRGLHRKLVDRLTIYNLPPIKEHTLARLPISGWLKNTRITQVEILDSILSGDFIHFGGPFDGQEKSLIILTVNRCFLYGTLTYDVTGTVNTQRLDNLRSLEVIDFSNNHLTGIASTAFQRIFQNLSTVILSHNDIRIIDVNAFRNIPLLKHVDLSHNLLENLIRGAFSSPARFLETINLSWNFLKVLPPDLFTNMPVLRTVNLSKNFLYSLPDKPWSIVWRQLRFVDLDGNFIDCDCDLLWLATTVQPRNEITASSLIEQPERILKGKCTYHKLPKLIGIEYELRTLTPDKLMCPIK